MIEADTGHKFVHTLLCLICMYLSMPISSLQDILCNHFAMPLIFGRAYSPLLESLR